MNAPGDDVSSADEVELLAKELCEICCYPAPNSWDEEDRGIWRMRAGILNDYLNRRKEKNNPGMERLDENKILEVFENLGTHILHYHDKEGRTTEEKVIHKARWIEIANAICARFGHTSVTEGDILESMRLIGSTHVPISRINGKTYHYMCKEDVAKAVFGAVRGSK